jgi:hypothetical protein
MLLIRMLERMGPGDGRSDGAPPVAVRERLDEDEFPASVKRKI